VVVGIFDVYLHVAGADQALCRTGVRIDAGMPDPTNRNYKLDDLDIVVALAAAAGFNAVCPDLLWLICPVLLYWISRALMMAHRRMMDDDPIAFALRDTRSLMAGAFILLIVLAAT
jgi:hypothetical protein